MRYWISLVGGLLLSGTPRPQHQLVWLKAPTNDLPAKATWLAKNRPVEGTTVGATGTGTPRIVARGGSCGLRVRPDVWYRFTSAGGKCMPPEQLVLRLRSAVGHQVRVGQIVGGHRPREFGPLRFEELACASTPSAAGGTIYLKLGHLTGSAGYDILVASLDKPGTFSIELAYDTPVVPCTLPGFGLEAKAGKRLPGRRRRDKLLVHVTDAPKNAEPWSVTLADDWGGRNTIIETRTTHGGTVIFDIVRSASSIYRVTVSGKCADGQLVSCASSIGFQSNWQPRR